MPNPGTGTFPGYERLERVTGGQGGAKFGPLVEITDALGAACDAQYLVLADLLGLGDGPAPKLAQAYAHLADDAVAAISRYREEVAARAFPDADHVY